jgi:hypothetical protein
MKSFALIVRRVHLYLTLICLPWFVMYGITAIAFNHKDWFAGPDDLYNVSGPNWTKEDSWKCSIEVPDEGQVPTEVAARMLEQAGIEADAFGAFRSGKKQVSAYVTEFWNTRRIVYDVETQQLSLFTRKPVTATTMTLMHSRAGYRHDSLPNDVWAIMVDTVVIAILVWVASGLYMWWQQKSLRRIGGVALIAGTMTFAAFLASL